MLNKYFFEFISFEIFVMISIKTTKNNKKQQDNIMKILCVYIRVDIFVMIGKAIFSYQIFGL